jgi:hypothetical protein
MRLLSRQTPEEKRQQESIDANIAYAKSFVKYAKIIMQEGYLQMLMYTGQFDLMMNEQDRIRCAKAMKARSIYLINQARERLKSSVKTGNIIPNALFNQTGVAKQYAEGLQAMCEGGNFSNYATREALFAYFEKKALAVAEEIRASFERGTPTGDIKEKNLIVTPVLDFLHNDCMKDFHKGHDKYARSLKK